MGYRIVQRAVRIDDGTTRVDSVLSSAWSRATSGGAYTTFLSNLVVTGTTPSYQLSDPKGTIVGTVTQAGAWATNSYPDEYGNITTVPASRLDWLGTQKRFVDHPGLDITRMGVRAYDPHLGRFLSQDPIAGGSANDYDYVNGDPINNLDLGGTYCVTGVKARHRVRSSGRRNHRPTWKTVETCNGAREVGRNVRRGAAPVVSVGVFVGKFAIGCLKLLGPSAVAGGAAGAIVGIPEFGAPIGAGVGCLLGGFANAITPMPPGQNILGLP